MALGGGQGEPGWNGTGRDVAEDLWARGVRGTGAEAVGEGVWGAQDRLRNEELSSECSRLRESLSAALEAVAQATAQAEESNKVRRPHRARACDALRVLRGCGYMVYAEMDL